MNVGYGLKIAQAAFAVAGVHLVRSRESTATLALDLRFEWNIPDFNEAAAGALVAFEV
jgi:hypothetical protein